MSESAKNSYGQILRSSSIVGASQVVTYALGMVRLKALALLLGPSGVGLFGYFQSVSVLIGTATNLGVASSAVRDVAAASATGDQASMGRTVRVLRRLCWVTGGAGLIVSCLLAWPLSKWSLGDEGKAWAIALLGVSLLCTSISAGQTALIQGLRRIVDLARINMMGAFLGTVTSVSCYYWMGESGIVPSLVFGSALTLLCSWWFSRKVPIPEAHFRWSETLQHARPLINLGLAFAWSGILIAGVGLLTRTLIIRDLGIEANGIYQAAWAISGLFAGFIVAAMGADFYPRLTEKIANQDLSNQLVNEQTEVGLLLAMPGLVGTLAFGPEILSLLYSKEFLTAADLLPWFVFGVLGKVLSWPMGFIILAKRSAKIFVFTETTTSALNVVILLLLLKTHGLTGVAISFAALYLFYSIFIYIVVRRVNGFRCSKSAKIYLAISVFFIMLVLLIQGMQTFYRIYLGVLVNACCAIFTLLVLDKRLGLLGKLRGKLDNLRKR